MDAERTGTSGAVHGGPLSGPASGSPQGAGGASAMTAIQGALLADPASRDGILSLQEDPLVQSILRDEATMRAIESGSLDVLLGHPGIRALAEHPTVRGIIERQGR